jgi:hypothetical protein
MTETEIDVGFVMSLRHYIAGAVTMFVVLFAANTLAHFIYPSWFQIMQAEHARNVAACNARSKSKDGTVLYSQFGNTYCFPKGDTYRWHMMMPEEAASP